MDMRVGLKKEMSAKELVLLNYGTTGEDSRVPWTARRSNLEISIERD